MSEPTKPKIQLTYKWCSPQREREIMLNLYSDSPEEADLFAAQLRELGLVPQITDPFSPVVLVESKPVQLAAEAPAEAEAEAKPAPKKQRQPEPEPVDDFEEFTPECREHGSDMIRSKKTSWPQWFCPARDDDGEYCRWTWTPKQQYRKSPPRQQTGSRGAA